MRSRSRAGGLTGAGLVRAQFACRYCRAVSGIGWAGAKYFSPVHMRRVVTLGRAPRFGVRRLLMVGRLRMDGARTGEKYFAPTHAVRGYIGAGATIHGVAMFDGWVMVD